MVTDSKIHIQLNFTIKTSWSAVHLYFDTVDCFTSLTSRQRLVSSERGRSGLLGRVSEKLGSGDQVLFSWKEKWGSGWTTRGVPWGFKITESLKIYLLYLDKSTIHTVSLLRRSFNGSYMSTVTLYNPGFLLPCGGRGRVPHYSPCLGRVDRWRTISAIVEFIQKKKEREGWT